MFKKKKKLGGFVPDSDIIHYLRFAVIPLIAVILIAVIISSDAGKKQDEADVTQLAASENGAESGVLPEGEEAGPGYDEESALAEQDAENTEAEYDADETGIQETGEAGSETEMAETETEETEASESETVSYADVDISQYKLVQDEVPEMSALVHTYCQAREDMDVELLARLYGITGLTEEQIAEEREKLELVHASIRRYENISCYSIEGPEEGSYVIFPYFELKYRDAEVNMPQLTWAYATRNDDGSYCMTQEVSQPVAEYIARIGVRDDVKALIAQVEEAKAEAVASDEKLQSIYGDTESEVILDTGSNQ